MFGGNLKFLGILFYFFLLFSPKNRGFLVYCQRVRFKMMIKFLIFNKKVLEKFLFYLLLLFNGSHLKAIPRWELK
jgi:hypothetical protein